MNYHINGKGNREECFANVRQCRFGGPLVVTNANTVTVLPNQPLSYDQADEMFDNIALRKANWKNPQPDQFWNSYLFNNFTWDNYRKQVPGILSQLSKHFPQDPQFAKCHPFGDFKDMGKSTADDFYDDWMSVLEKKMYSKVLKKEVEVFDAIYHESCEYQQQILGSVKISEPEYRKILSVYFARMAKGFSMEGVARSRLNKMLKNKGNTGITIDEAPSVLEIDDIDAVIKYKGVVVGYISIKCFGALSSNSRNMWRQKSHAKKKLNPQRKVPHFFMGYDSTRSGAPLKIYGHSKDELMNLDRFLECCDWLIQRSSANKK